MGDTYVAPGQIVSSIRGPFQPFCATELFSNVRFGSGHVGSDAYHMRS